MAQGLAPAVQHRNATGPGTGMSGVIVEDQSHGAFAHFRENVFVVLLMMRHPARNLAPPANPTRFRPAGRTTAIPDNDAARAVDPHVMLPRFVRPGEPRFSKRTLPFVHRFRHPENPDGTVILLLHGTGGNEADLMPPAARLNPIATLPGLRGRAAEEGIARFFQTLWRGHIRPG